MPHRPLQSGPDFRVKHICSQGSFNTDLGIVVFAVFNTNILCALALSLIKVSLCAQVTGIACIPLEYTHAYSAKDFRIQQNTTSSFKEKLQM